MSLAAFHFLVVRVSLQRLLCQIRISPTAERMAPYSAHCRLPIMKLEAGQAIAPVPWPIHNSPIASARKPSVTSSLRMSFHSLEHDPDPEGSRQRKVGAGFRKTIMLKNNNLKRDAMASRFRDRIQCRPGRQGG